MSRFLEIIESAKKRREEGLKENPRYDIDCRANEHGELRIYFHSAEELKAYQNGIAVKGSTERFFDTDLFVMVPKELIEKITDGGTVAHIYEAPAK